MRQERMDWMAMVRGIGTALVTAVALSAGAAQMVSSGMVGEDWLNYLAAGILIAASFLGGIMAGGVWEAVGSGVGLWLLLVGINAVFYNFEMSGGGETLLAILGGSGAASLLRIRKKSTSRRRRKTRIVKLNKKLH